jgi:4-aminobutyrate aminotransferase-like enzyme
MRLFEETKKRGLLVGKSGLYGNVFRVAPPLNITASECDEGLRIMRESFAAIHA